jgi:hypothetical protein
MKRLWVTRFVSVVALYGAVQRLGRTWGSTRADRARVLPGDERCAKPDIVTDHAVTINAPPSAIWPWLVQMGWGRAQWYTARWVDRLLFPNNGPSADRIVPEWQLLKVGDRILDGPPEANCAFVVEALDPLRHLVLHSREHLPPGWAERYDASIDFTWTFVLDRLDDDTTRFHFRSRAQLAPRWVRLGYLALLPSADLIMARQMLRGVKQRAETLTASVGQQP